MKGHYSEIAYWTGDLIRNILSTQWVIILRFQIKRPNNIWDKQFNAERTLIYFSNNYNTYSKCNVQKYVKVVEESRKFFDHKGYPAKSTRYKYDGQFINEISVNKLILRMIKIKQYKNKR